MESLDQHFANLTPFGKVLFVVTFPVIVVMTLIMLPIALAVRSYHFATTVLDNIYL